MCISACVRHMYACICIPVFSMSVQLQMYIMHVLSEVFESTHMQ